MSWNRYVWGGILKYDARIRLKKNNTSLWLKYLYNFLLQIQNNSSTEWGAASRVLLQCLQCSQGSVLYVSCPSHSSEGWWQLENCCELWVSLPSCFVLKHCTGGLWPRWKCLAAKWQSWWLNVPLGAEPEPQQQPAAVRNPPAKMWEEFAWVKNTLDDSS